MSANGNADGGMKITYITSMSNIPEMHLLLLAHEQGLCSRDLECRLALRCCQIALV